MRITVNDITLQSQEMRGSVVVGWGRALEFKMRGLVVFVELISLEMLASSRLQT